MTLTRRIEWNGKNNILILDNGAHGHIEMTLDEFVELADDLKTSLLFQAEAPAKKPGSALSMPPEASDRLRGEMERARAEGLDYTDWLLKQRMDAAGVAWTRDNYIEWHWNGELPEEWDEDEIPEDLQDWEKGGP
jgi:hypothetical protein